MGKFDASSLPASTLEHDRAALLGDDGVVVVEDARVLRDRVERDAERAERLAVHEWLCAAATTSGRACVDRRVDHERGTIDRLRAVHDVARVVDQDEVADAHVAEALAERVDPEAVGELGVAHGDVAGDAFAETEPSEDAQRTGELLLAMQRARPRPSSNVGGPVEADLLGCELDAVDRAGSVSVMPCAILRMCRSASVGTRHGCQRRVPSTR